MHTASRSTLTEMIHAVRHLPSTLDLYKVGFSAITISNIEYAVYRLQHLLSITSYYLYAHTGYQSLPKHAAYDQLGRD